MTPQWLAQRERSNVLAIRFIVWIATVLGRRATQLFLYPICLYFVTFSLKARRASREYLRRVLDREPTWRDLFRHYFTFATVTLDRIYLLRGREDPFDIHLHGEELIAELLAKGQGALLLGAHFGSFEIGRVLGRLRRDHRIRMMMFGENAQKIQTVLSALNPEFASSIISMGKLDSMIKLGHYLNDGEFVGMLGDRLLADGNQVSLPFLGAPATFPMAPYWLASILKQPVVLMVGLYRGGNRYDLYFEKLIDVTHVDRKDRARITQEWLKLYVARLEHYCRLAPFNWFNFYDFWETQHKNPA
ncbi:MAG: acyl-CoA synthetase [Burkholderiales bacterium]